VTKRKKSLHIFNFFRIYFDLGSILISRGLFENLYHWVMNWGGEMRTVVLVLCILSTGLLLWHCNKGIHPTEAEAPAMPGLNFPVPPEGGDPVGFWEPQPENPAEVHLVDPSQIAGLVDSLYLETHLEGHFDLRSDQTSDVEIYLSVTPHVYLPGASEPWIMPAIKDSIKATGPYQILEQKALVFDLPRSTFQLDTLGFSVQDSTLTLISLPNTFPYPGFSHVKFYFLFRLRRLSHL